MQKSAHTNIKPARPRPQPVEAALDTADKGQKFEPFCTLAMGSDRRSLARGRQADQKR